MTVAELTREAQLRAERDAIEHRAYTDMLRLGEIRAELAALTTKDLRE